jgi:ribosomal protein S18 acetylase RimI-like enzyme
MAEVTLRPETEDDLLFLLQVYASTRSQEMAMVPWTEEQKNEFVRSQFGFQRKHYREHYHDAQFDVILADGQAAGRLCVHRGPLEIRVVDIALLPEFRGQGIGGGLIRELQTEAARSGRPLTIHVERFNPALRLYERLGFRIAGEQGPVYLFMEYRG